MGKEISKWILVIMVACISFAAVALDDDDDKKPIKKIILIKNGNPGKINKTGKEDTLVYDKKDIDDTLTFDGKKTFDDTLIFADDEMQMKGKPNGQNGKREFSLVNSENSNNLKTVIYPNPSFGQSVLEMNIPDNTSTEIIITSQDGTLIRKENTTGKSYELNDLAAGTYLITIKNGNQVVQKRLFVK